MNTELLIKKITQYLQAEYVKTGLNDPVEWRPLAPNLEVSEDEVSNALHVALDPAGGQLDLQMAGRDHIQLGVRSLADAEAERTKNVSR